MARLTAIAAVATGNRGIGLDGGVPWDIPEDWQRFLRVTEGSNLIMGRKTFERIGEPLANRISVVISRSQPAPASAHPRVRWVSTIDAALEACEPLRASWVAGGGEIYRLAWKYLTDLDLTEVHLCPPADTFFPEVDPDEWVETSREPHDGFDFVGYRRLDLH